MLQVVKARVEHLLKSMKDKKPGENLSFLSYIFLKQLACRGEPVPGFVEWEYECSAETRLSENITAWKDHNRKDPYTFKWDDIYKVTEGDKEDIIAFLTLRWSIDAMLLALRKD
ncbi:unannotated protein [freshwater metagenome]|uniref:Unannotated protein n=1 Tax=freshwater metagenome TaxID=449393 RepID=A0A6J7EDI5_9ZZZZ